MSRAALKLVAALDHFQIDPRNCECLDVGASTGGFTEVLLKRGASHVTSIDVGHGQIHPRIENDRRVTSIEGFNARFLTSDDIDNRPINFIVSDVSFISLKLALAPALELAEPEALAILLVKPQFEAGRDAISKAGLLKEPETAPAVAAELERWLVEDMGWVSLGLIPSPIAGGDGNEEFLLGGKNHDRPDREDTEPRRAGRRHRPLSRRPGLCTVCFAGRNGGHCPRQGRGHDHVDCRGCSRTA